MFYIYKDIFLLINANSLDPDQLSAEFDPGLHYMPRFFM